MKKDGRQEGTRERGLGHRPSSIPNLRRKVANNRQCGLQRWETFLLALFPVPGKPWQANKRGGNGLAGLSIRVFSDRRKTLLFHRRQSLLQQLILVLAWADNSKHRFEDNVHVASKTSTPQIFQLHSQLHRHNSFQINVLNFVGSQRRKQLFLIAKVQCCITRDSGPHRENVGCLFLN